MAEIKSMSLEQAQAYKAELKSKGKTLSTSKEMGKVEDYIKTLSPEKYGRDTVASAYEKLSSGVTKTGGWTEANADKIFEYTGKYPQFQTQAGGGDLSSYLQSYQDGVYGSAGSLELRKSIAAQLEPDMAKPEPLNRVAEFEKMRGQMGVADNEALLNDLKAQLEEQYAMKRARTTDAQGKPVAMGVIAGRISEVERQEMERIDAIGRQINVVTDQLNTAYNTISTYINYMGMDYQDAVNAYQADFNKNLQIYKLVDEELDEQRANARANLQIYQNALISGNINYSSLSSDQKAFLTKLEVQAGLPVGFSASLKPDEKVLYSGTRESGGVKYLDMITQGADGKPISSTISLGASGIGGSGRGVSVSEASYNMTEAIRYAMNDAKNMGISYEGSQKLWITPTQAKPLIEWWKENTGKSEADWYSRFGKYVIKQ